MYVLIQEVTKSYGIWQEQSGSHRCCISTLVGSLLGLVFCSLLCIFYPVISVGSYACVVFIRRS
jgi:hypothetical protein